MFINKTDTILNTKSSRKLDAAQAHYVVWILINGLVVRNIHLLGRCANI